ncbi:glycosyltransferase [Roseateles koreensis]|uniref:Glycosyltransferase n=1 Tax=Roseateles koreensis TaxID=2987526 RepID=A0ABT5KV57_9BURK|nr:glycosyltransferase [Roseateles koreensis]MDC8786691.1 glycosyltransferase [Roseateles koreensis]
MDAIKRVLVVHAAYQQRGGEDTVVEAEVALLREHGCEVELYCRSNDDLNAMGHLTQVQNTLWSNSTYGEVDGLMQAFKPEIVHVHNTFPVISPSVYWVVRKHKTPLVQTLHNFRLLCPQATLLRQGAVCEDCVGHLPWRGAVRGCYRGSVSQSSVIASMLALHRGLGSFDRAVTRYIALNEFCRNKFIEGGLAAGKISIKPNFVDLPELPDGPRAGMLYVGRLSEEKGLDVLLQATALLEGLPPLRVIGDGPLRHLLVGRKDIEYLGELPSDQVYAEMRRAQCLVIPSICYENFPRTLVEAYACGLPVIASRLGPMPDLIEEGQTGLLFDPGKPESLGRVLSQAVENSEKLRVMGLTARRKYQVEMTGLINIGILESIYLTALEEFNCQ